MGFETFKRQRVPLTTEPAITIQKRGTVSINMPAYEAMGSPKTIELLFDRDQRLMGMQKVDPPTAHSYTVRPLGKGNTWLISGIAFMNYYGIKTDVARRWIGHVNDDGLLVIDLKEPGTEVAGNRGRGRVVEAALEGP